MDTVGTLYFHPDRNVWGEKLKVWKMGGTRMCFPSSYDTIVE